MGPSIAVLNSTLLNSGTLSDSYDLGPEIGRGQYGVVRECRERATGRRFACKSIAKASLATRDSRDAVRREVAIMRRLAGCPGVVSLAGVWEDSRAVHLVMDLCAGGDLLRLVELTDHLAESPARAVFAEIARAVAECHARGVLHRDVKPENVLLTRPVRDNHVSTDLIQDTVADRAVQGESECGSRRHEAKGQNFCDSDDGSLVKLTDFGLSLIEVADCRGAKEIAGSAYYLAPEVFSGRYSFPADVWSLGVVLFVLLSGCVPFGGDDDDEIGETIREGSFTFDEESGSVWAEVSSVVKDLICWMLTKEENQRPTAEQILRHPWLSPTTEAAFYSATQVPTALTSGWRSNSLDGAYKLEHYDEDILYSEYYLPHLISHSVPTTPTTSYTSDLFSSPSSLVQDAISLLGSWSSLPLLASLSESEFPYSHVSPTSAMFSPSSPTKSPLSQSGREMTGEPNKHEACGADVDLVTPLPHTCAIQIQQKQQQQPLQLEQKQQHGHFLLPPYVGWVGGGLLF
ncbi:hypothetical protein CLOM_g6652 [Closterium sp. NIES-68]|nr:hypothetical protein CLOM_g6652 [Closterium sp. NIES-68]